MTTRLLVAYSMIAALAACGLFALWVFVLRENWARRGRRVRFNRERARAARAAPDRPQEAAPAD